MFGAAGFHARALTRPGGIAILGVLRKLAKSVSTEDFAIDEKPCRIIELERSTAPAAEPAAEGRTATVTSLAEPPSGARPDLASSVRVMLAEQGRLAQIAKELKPASATDDEFGRFARQAVQTIDALDRIVDLGRTHEQSEEFSGWFRSVEALYERMQRLFENYDLRLMHCMGQNVDFNIHDVIEYRRTNEYPHNTVIQEIRKGIVFRGRVLRDAKVVVACNEGREPG